MVNMRQGDYQFATLPYASFWSRLAAKLVDTAIVSLANLTVANALKDHTPLSEGAFGLAMTACFYLFQVAYSVFFLERWAATPGKMALGLKVVAASGAPISSGRAFGRSFAEMLSSFIFYIGYLMALGDEQMRTLHDRICDTRVVRR